MHDRSVNAAINLKQNTVGYTGINAWVQEGSDLARTARLFLKKSGPPRLSQSFSRDPGRHDLFCTSLCACRCLRASDRGPDRGHGPSDDCARNARAHLANIRRTRPVAPVPVIMTARRIPVAVDPHELFIFRIGAWRANGDRSRWGRCTDLNSD